MQEPLCSPYNVTSIKLAFESEICEMITAYALSVLSAFHLWHMKISVTRIYRENKLHIQSFSTGFSCMHNNIQRVMSNLRLSTLVVLIVLSLQFLPNLIAL